MSTKYFGRDGRQCQKVEWRRLRDDDAYRIVREYDNEEISISIEWLGAVENAESLFPDCYKLFGLHVCNYNSVGNPTKDPVENGRTFPDEAAAIAAYEKFIERWTESQRNEDGVLVEEGNNLAPPPPPIPPNPDAPSSDVSGIKGIVDDGVGAW